MSSSLKRVGGEVIVMKFSYNILDDVRGEQIPSKHLSKVIYANF